MIVDFFNGILILVLVLGAGWFAYMSSVLVSEKKARYKAGITDYYDNPINKGKSNAKQKTDSKRSQIDDEKLQRQSKAKTTKRGISAKGKGRAIKE